MIYLSDEMKKRLAKSRYYEKVYPFPRVKIHEKEMTVPEFVREAGATSPEWSMVFNKICEDIEKAFHFGFEAVGTASFWGLFHGVLTEIEKRTKLSELAERDNCGDQ